MYSGYELSEESRNKLKMLLVPIFNNFMGHHITEKFGVAADYPTPEMPDSVVVVGRAIDKKLEVDALLVEINGSSNRPDGSKYHITWSLGANAKPVDSNKIINSAEYLDSPIPIRVQPKVFTKSTKTYIKGAK